MEISVLATLLGFAGAIAVQTWGLIRFFLNRIDDKHDTVTTLLDDHVKDLHNRVNGVKDTYVSRAEMDREMTALKDLIVSIKTDTHLTMQEIKADQNRMMQQINSRLDTFCGGQK